MRKAFLLVGSCVGLAMLLMVTIATQPFAAPQDALQKWGPNDRNRPEPPIITPGTASTQEHPGTSTLGCHRALQRQGFVQLGKR